MESGGEYGGLLDLNTENASDRGIDCSRLDQLDGALTDVLHHVELRGQGQRRDLGLESRARERGSYRGNGPYVHSLIPRLPYQTASPPLIRPRQLAWTAFLREVPARRGETFILADRTTRDILAMMLSRLHERAKRLNAIVVALNKVHQSYQALPRLLAHQVLHLTGIREGGVFGNAEKIPKQRRSGKV